MTEYKYKFCGECGQELIITRRPHTPQQDTVWGTCPERNKTFSYFADKSKHWNVYLELVNAQLSFDPKTGKKIGE